MRKRRLDLGLLQGEAAARIGVHVTTLTNWEVGRTTPALVHRPRVFDFLGYVPYNPGWPLSSRLQARREALGFT